DLAESPGPGQQIPVAGWGGGDAHGVQPAAEPILGMGDMDVAVGVDPDRFVVGWMARAGRVGGQHCDGSVGTGFYQVTLARLAAPGGAAARPGGDTAAWP